MYQLVVVTCLPNTVAYLHALLVQDVINVTFTVYASSYEMTSITTPKSESSVLYCLIDQLRNIHFVFLSSGLLLFSHQRG